MAFLHCPVRQFMLKLSACVLQCLFCIIQFGIGIDFQHLIQMVLTIMTIIATSKTMLGAPDVNNILADK